MLIIIFSFCSYVEYRASSRSSIVFYLRIDLLPLSTFFQPSVVPSLLLFSSLLLVYSPSLYPDSSSPMCVCLMYTLWFTQCMANPMPFSFLYLLFNRCLLHTCNFYNSYYQKHEKNNSMIQGRWWQLQLKSHFNNEVPIFIQVRFWKMRNDT
jgi:hypothetical protein